MPLCTFVCIRGTPPRCCTPCSFYVVRVNTLQQTMRAVQVSFHNVVVSMSKMDTFSLSSALLLTRECAIGNRVPFGTHSAKKV